MKLYNFKLLTRYLREQKSDPWVADVWLLSIITKIHRVYVFIHVVCVFVCVLLSLTWNSLLTIEWENPNDLTEIMSYIIWILMTVAALYITIVQYVYMKEIKSSKLQLQTEIEQKYK